MSCSNYTNGSGAPIVIAGSLDPAFCHTDWQTTFQTFVQSMAATLPGNYAGLVTGDSTPAASDQDKLWYRTTASCVPVGFFVYYNGAWVRAVPHHMPPGSIIDYYDAAFIGQSHVLNKRAITYLDVYEVTPSTSVDYSNPFWRWCDGTSSTPDLRGTTTVCAGQGSGLSDRLILSTGFGTESEAIQPGNLPVLSVPLGVSAGTGGVMKALPDGTTLQINSTSGAAHNNMQPSFVTYKIIRTSRIV